MSLANNSDDLRRFRLRLLAEVAAVRMAVYFLVVAIGLLAGAFAVTDWWPRAPLAAAVVVTVAGLIEYTLARRVATGFEKKLAQLDGVEARE